MDKSSAVADPLQIPLPLAYSAGILCFHMLCNWLPRCRCLLRRCVYNHSTANLCRPPTQPRITRETNMHDMTTTQNIAAKDELLSREEVEMVMGSLGIVCNSDSNDQLMQEAECFGPAQLSALFEELEPSLDELKEAFSVFDANRDGFIDAKELHRILCKLGLSDRYSVSACEMMIRAVSKNGYERIDLKEFLNFMENDLCRLN